MKFDIFLHPTPDSGDKLILHVFNIILTRLNFDVVHYW